QRPPDTRRFVPVVYEAASDSRNTTASATSSGVPARGIGIIGASRSSRPGGCSPVAISPGETALTRMLSAASSRDKPTVMLSIAPFEAAYQTYSPALPSTAPIDEMSTIAPPCPLFFDDIR